MATRKKRKPKQGEKLARSRDELVAALADLRAKIEDYDPRDLWDRAADNHAAYDHDKLFPKV